MLVAISGSQGTGKTTILNELRERGCNVVERKTARSILNDWGVTLDTVNSDSELKQAFQMELVQRKYADEVELALSEELYFTERTFADLFTYSLIAFGQYNQYDQWLDDYYNICKEHSQNYMLVFYVESKFSHNIESDGVRSTNQHYSRMIDTVMLDVTKSMIHQDKLWMLSMKDLEQRVSYVLNKTVNEMESAPSKALDAVLEKIKD
jgi:predicted ATPase